MKARFLTRVKGGFSVEVDVVKAFLPGSLVDIRPVKEAPELENTVQEFKVIKLDYKRNNVVLSRKAVLEKINSAEKVELLKNLDEGQIVKGVVKNLTDYGAFVDLGGSRWSFTYYRYFMVKSYQPIRGFKSWAGN